MIGELLHPRLVEKKQVAGARIQQIGIAWLTMAVAFEFLFGRLVAHKPWGELLQAYDPSTGNLWLLVLLTIAVSPWLAARIRGIMT